MRSHTSSVSLSASSSVLLALVLTGCAHTVDQAGVDGVAPAALVWYLPKTEGIAVTVASEITGCSPALIVAVRAEAVPVVTTDWTRRHSVTVEGLGGPFGTAELAVEAWPEGMVKSLGGKSEDRIGPTAVAVAETVLRVLAPVTLTAEAGQPQAATCTTAAFRATALLAAAQAALTAAPLDDKVLTGRTAQIERLRAALRIRQTFTVPLEPAPPPAPIGAASHVLDGMPFKKAGLLTADPFGGRVRATLERAYATPPAAGAGLAVADEAFHYREPVRLVMTARVNCPDAKDCPVRESTGEAVPFGVAQWGVPRRLPLRVGLFGNVSFSFDFQQDGTLVKQRGATMAAPAEGAASAARTIAGDVAAFDPRTAALKARTSRVQAELDLRQAQAKLDALKASAAAAADPP